MSPKPGSYLRQGIQQTLVNLVEAAVARFPDRLIPYVYALPGYAEPVLPRIEEALSSRGFRGIKIHAGECRIAEYTTDPVFELAGTLRVPCLVDFGGNLDAAALTAERFPQTTVIIAHIGKYLCTDDDLIDAFISLAERSPNVCLDVSGVVRLWKIPDAVRRIGGERVLWGTDGPHPTPDTASFARMELEKMKTCGLSRADLINILGGTAARLLGL